MITRVKEAKMIDISGKEDNVRISIAEGVIKLKKYTLEAIKKGETDKGDVLSTAAVSAILAVKKTSELIPMCHPIPITSARINYKFLEDGIKVSCEVKSLGKTGVEMEALTGVTVALLTIWDMVKSMEKDETGNYPETSITDVKVISKIKSSSGA